MSSKDTLVLNPDQWLLFFSGHPLSFLYDVTADGLCEMQSPDCEMIANVYEVLLPTILYAFPHSAWLVAATIIFTGKIRERHQVASNPDSNHQVAPADDQQELNPFQTGGTEIVDQSQPQGDDGQESNRLSAGGPQNIQGHQRLELTDFIYGGPDSLIPTNFPTELFAEILENCRSGGRNLFRLSQDQQSVTVMM